MSDEKAKGSIIYEVLIVVLAIVLIWSIIYPKIITENEEFNTTACRERMNDILNAELQFQKYNTVYSDSLNEVVEFLKTNTQYSTYVDSIIRAGLDSTVTQLNNFLSLENLILSNLSAPMDTVMRDSLIDIQQNLKMESRRLAGYIEYVHDRMKNLPNTPVEQLKRAFLTVDSKKFTLDMDIVKNLIENEELTEAQKTAEKIIENITSVIAEFNKVLVELDEFQGGKLDSLFYCPTVYKPYHIVSEDTAVIKYIHIFCPIDSQDVQTFQSNFFKSKIGGLNINNHGKVVKGEKSWEAGQ